MEGDSPAGRDHVYLKAFSLETFQENAAERFLLTSWIVSRRGHVEGKKKDFEIKAESVFFFFFSICHK